MVIGGREVEVQWAVDEGRKHDRWVMYNYSTRMVMVSYMEPDQEKRASVIGNHPFHTS